MNHPTPSQINNETFITTKLKTSGHWLQKVILMNHVGSCFPSPYTIVTAVST